MKDWLHYLPHLLGLVLVKSLSDHVIRKTESIAANSTAELFSRGFKRLFKMRGTSNNMKTLLSVANGALTVTEEGGVVSLNIDASLGGGDAAGMVKGQASVQLNAQAGLQLGEKLLNAHLPSSVQALASVVETVANSAVAAIE